MTGARGLFVLAALLSAACGGEPELRGEERAAAVVVGPEDYARVEAGTLERGPIISGRLAAEREAAVRAEVGGAIVSVRAREGEAVRRGAVLATIDAAALADQRLSARSAVASAETALEVARREAARLATLAEAGAVAEQQVEAARQAVRTAEAQLADARARLALAEEQIARTTVRAPIAGIVSERPINAGDVVQPGALLFTIVDPSDMQLEGTIPAAELADVEVGDPVRFEVTGYPGRTFEGRVARISPAADPATGQVRVFVTVPNDGRDLVTGLFARGRIGVEAATGAIVPASAVRDADGQTLVTVVRDGRTATVPVVVGLRDPLTEQLLIDAGVSPGDVVLLGAAHALTEGTEVRLAAPIG